MPANPADYVSTRTVGGNRRFRPMLATNRTESDCTVRIDIGQSKSFANPARRQEHLLTEGQPSPVRMNGTDERLA